MTISTVAKLPTIARMIALKYPEIFHDICQETEPMLRNISLVPQIYQRILNLFPDDDSTWHKIYFCAAVYHAYSPATMQGAGLERLPNGIRSQMCELMGWKDAPTVNHFHGIAVAYFKGRSFRDKVDLILEAFQGYSVKSQQTKLF